MVRRHVNFSPRVPVPVTASPAIISPTRVRDADRLRISLPTQPFFHSTTGAKHIMWGARDRLGLNFGVLTAYVLDARRSCPFFPLVADLSSRSPQLDRALDLLVDPLRVCAAP